MDLRLQIDVAKHLTAVLHEFKHQLAHFFRILNAVPEQNLAVACDGAIGLLAEPGQILIVLLDSPRKFGDVTF